jgi:formyltetrahydrofolate-dependent phosphoribosylglycinamide formyltransferase
VGVLVSGQGRGTNLQAILDACADSAFPARVAVVIGTKSDAPAMERARSAGVPAVTVSPKRFESDEAYGEALYMALTESATGLICLAGYLRILPPRVVAEYRHRILNVHPALLPFFGGKGMYGHHVHEAVLASGMKVAGCTVHLVDEEYDTGPIVLQRCVPVLEDDTPESLAARILPEEHRAYVDAICLIAEGRMTVDGRRVRVQESANV